MAVMKKPKIKSIPYEDFKDNETFEKLVAELNANGTNVIVRSLDELIDWGRSNSLWPLTFATSCCGIEFMAVCAARYDIARFGFEVTRNSPRQADVILVSGTITTKMAPGRRAFVPGCPPRPESFLYGMMQLQRKVKVENFFGTTNRKQKDPYKAQAAERAQTIYNEEEQA